MDKKLNDFVKTINKLTDYFIIREEDKYILLATNIVRKVHREITNSIFQPYSHNKNVEFQVFFVICTKEDLKEIQALKARNVLILEIDDAIIKAPLDEIQQYFDDWLITKFY